METSIIICLIILVILLFFDRGYLKRKYLTPYNSYMKSLALLRKWVNNENISINSFPQYDSRISENLLEETNNFLNYTEKSLND